MFKSKAVPVKLDPDTTDTLVGEGSSFEGNIKSDASIRIEGKVTGDIECKGDVTIGEKGQVQSNISARNVIIAGTVTGDIQTKSKLSITSTGKLFGNIEVASLSIEEGSVFEGSSRMSSQTDTAPSASKEAAATSEKKSEKKS
ncbi:polymer-forming cytoskeletal protein [Paenibacillus woosongensis]|uniref:Polymer-forming cytoskeletal protein n=1 Tax=Paenibacillus woosongensis TaxID=307580 RepID=A0AA95L0F8_9BACL|nr:polymer-forming cytoskeletal protein [Paenibacillus woosongensis]WHX48189.1 polymer-forming cytoskeletal protein [Paenibacillus woosongensis]